jgi:hypothetical protein
LTFDRLRYDFQAVGEFELVKATNGENLDIQIRLQPWNGSLNVSVVTAVALQVGNDRVTFDVDRPDIVYINGKAATISVGNPIGLSGGALYQTSPAAFEVAYNTGEVVTLPYSLWGFNVSVWLGNNHSPGGVEGLLGNYNGNPANDLTLADGTVIAQPVGSSVLYGSYADAWRVTDSTSLFDYLPGQSTSSFTDKSFPAYTISLRDIPPSVLNQVTALAEAAGISLQGLQESAILDFLATGDASFITDAANIGQQGLGDTTDLQVNAPPPPPEVGIAAAQSSVTLSPTGETPVAFEVYRTTSVGDLTVNYTVVTPGSGYVDASAFGGLLPSGQVTIPDGQTTAQFVVTLEGGIGSKASEILQVSLSNSNATAVIGQAANTVIVNNQPTAGLPAVPAFEGPVKQNGNHWTYDLGALQQGAQLAPVDFLVANHGVYGADTLTGSLEASGSGFGVTLGGPFTGLAATAYLNDISVTADTSTPGVHTETITLHSSDTNASGYDAALPDQILTITDTVYPTASVAINTPLINFGKVRGGTSLSSAVSITNTANANGTVLGASVQRISGPAFATGQITGLQPGATDASDLLVGLGTSLGGQFTGTVTLAFADSDAGGITAVSTGTVQLSVTVYARAQARFLQDTFYAHVGDTPQLPFGILNATKVVGGYAENLIVNPVSSTGGFAATGTTGDLAGGESGFGITISFPTVQAGTVDGSVTVDEESDGNGLDGQGILDLGNQPVEVHGVVNNFANAAFEKISGGGTFSQNGNNYTLDLGTVAAGAVATVNLGILNNVAGPADLLSGSFAISGDNTFLNTGFAPFLNLGAGEEALPTVAFESDSTGSFSETITLHSLGSNPSGYAGALTDRTLTITAQTAPYNLAMPVINTASPINFGAVRAGQTVTTHLSISNDGTVVAGSPNNIVDTLAATIGGVAGQATASGSFSELQAGASSSTDLEVGLATTNGLVGAQSGIVTLNFSSQSNGAAPYGTAALPSQQIGVDGIIFREASGYAPAQNFYVHVGDTGTAQVGILNGVDADGFSENLIASVAGSSGGITAGNSTVELAPHQSANFAIDFSTATAQVIQGSVTFNLQSDGNGIDGLPAIDIGQKQTDVTVTVDNFAQALIQQVGGTGTLSHVGNAYSLDLGTIAQGSAPVVANLGVLNSATGPADSLGGSFTISGDPFIPGSGFVFTNTGFSGFSSLATGFSDASPEVTINTGVAGSFQEQITLHSFGYNYSGYSGALADQTLTVTGTVAQTPALSVPGPITVNEDTSTALPLIVSPAIAGDTVSLTVSGLPPGASLTNSNSDTLTISGGTITFSQAQLSAGVLNGLTLHTGETGATLTVTANESGPNPVAAAVQSISLTVNAVAEAPTVTVPGPIGLSEGGSAPLPLTIAAADPDDTLSLTITGLPSDATLTNTNGNPLIIQNGSITFSQAQLTAGVLNGLTLHAGETSATLSVTGKDTESNSTASSVAQTIALTVAPVAEPPGLTVSGPITLDEGGSAPLPVSVTPVDGDDTLSLTISGLPSDATLSNSHADTLTIQNGSISFTQAQLTGGVLAGLTLHTGELSGTLDVTAVNAEGGSTMKSIVLTVVSVAEAPTVTVPGPLSVNELGSADLPLTIASVDGDDTLSLKITGLPSDATLSNTNADILTIQNGSITFSQAQLTAGVLNGLTLHVGETSATLSVTGTDSEGNSTASSVAKTVAVTVLTGPPNLSVPGPLTVNEGNPIPVVITATPFAQGATVSVTISGIPSDATLSDTGGPLPVVNGSVTLTPSQLAGLTLHAGETGGTLSVSATEGSSTASNTIGLTVTPVAEAPGLSVPASILVNEDSGTSLPIAVTPVDGDDTLSLTITGIPSDVTLSNSNGDMLTIQNGSIAFNQAQLSAGVLNGLTLHAGELSGTLSVTAGDSEGNSTASSPTKTITLTVTPVAEDPTLTAPALITLSQGQAALPITVMAADGDDTLSLNIRSLPADATLTNSNGDTLVITNGSITFSQAQLTAGVLNGLTLLTGQIVVNLIVTATDTEGNSTASVTKTTTVPYTAIWANPNGGNWNVAGNWVGSSLPISTDSVLINLAPGQTVTFNSGSTTVKSISIQGGGTLATSGGVLTVTGSLDVAAGVLQLNGGTIAIATITTSGGTVAYNGGTLSGVTYGSAMDLSANNSYVYVANGLTATGQNINLTGVSDTAYFEGNQTIDNATINLGSAAGGYADYIYNYDTDNTGSVLTLGPNTIVNVNTPYYDYFSSAGSNQTGDGIVNQGTINVQGASGSSLYIQTYNFTNQGTIHVAIGNSLYLQSGTLTNTASGVISGDGTTVYFYSFGNFSNSGTLSLTNSAIHLYGTYSTAQLSLLGAGQGNTIYIDGTLTNTGQTLNVGTGLASLVLAYDGTIAGGTIVDQGSGLKFQGGTLNGVTYDGTMDLSANSSYFYAVNGLTMHAVNGGSPGTLSLTGVGDTVYFEGNQTLDNATITLGSAAGGYADYIYNYDTDNTGSVLTLGPNTIVNVNTPYYAYLYSTGYNVAGDGIVNQGTINVQGASGSSLYIQTYNFTNQGTIHVASGDTLYLQSGTLTNTASGVISGDGTTVYFYSFGNFSNSGTLNLTNSAIHLYGTYSTAQLSLLGAGQGNTIYIDGTLTNTGHTLNVGPGTGLPSVVLASDGTIDGGTIVDQGSGLKFQGGTLNGVTYDGTMDLSANSSYFYAINGLTMHAVNGSGPGMLNLTGVSDTVYFEGNQTIDNATINLGSVAGGYSDNIYNYDTDNTGSVLTLGPNTIVNVNTPYYDYFSSTGSNQTGDGIVNQGTINVQGASGSSLYIQTYNFTNQGTIHVASGDALSLQSGTLTNTASGVISGDGTTVYFYSFGNFSNSGTLNLTNSAIHLYGTYSTAQLSLLGAGQGNTIYIDGTLTNTGQTLNVGPGTGLPSVVLASDGTIDGGTIVDQGAGLKFQGGTLNGVTYDGTMDLSANSSYFYVANGLTMHAVNGSGPGMLNLTGVSDTVYFEGNQTIDNSTITLGSAAGGYSDQIYNYDTDNTGSVLTLGPNTIVNVNTPYYDYFSSTGSNHTGDGIVNQGTINVQGASGSSLYIQPYNFTNQGIINSTNGDVLYVSSSTSFTNSGQLNANGGNINVTVAETGSGSATIYGTSQIAYSAGSHDNVTFAQNSTGELLLFDSQDFKGTVAGFTGTGVGDPAHSDKMDLRDVNFLSPQFSKNYQNNVLTVMDGTHTANINIVGNNYSLANFNFDTDKNNGTLITDPPTTDQSGTGPSDTNGIALLTQYMASSLVATGGTQTGGVASDASDPSQQPSLTQPHN